VRARWAVAILSLALLYACTCSATCALCLGAGVTPLAASASHDCQHAASDAAGGAQKQRPAKPDCAGHHHANFEIVQVDGLKQLRFGATNHAHASQVLVQVVGAEAVVGADSFLSDLAPPRDRAVFPQQMLSILRI
jgi:hypothetical protein